MPGTRDDAKVWCTPMTSDDKNALWMALFVAIVLVIVVITR